MDTKILYSKIEEIVKPVADGLNLRFVDAEYVNDHGRWVLRVFIEKADGAPSIDDCAKVSRAVAAVLDVEDLIPHRYNLEVSTPGLDRLIKRPEDFERYKGKMLRLKTKAPIDNRANYYGTLLGMNGDQIMINVDGKEYRIPIDMLQKARLEFKVEKKEKKV